MTHRGPFQTLPVCESTSLCLTVKAVDVRLVLPALLVLASHLSQTKDRGIRAVCPD